MRHKRVMVRRDENFLYDGGGINDFLFDYNGIDLDHTSVLWVLGWKRTEEVFQAHSLQKLESQFQMVRSYDQEENHPKAGCAHDSSHPRQSWVPESCYSADLFVSSNQAKEIPNCDSNS